LTTLAPVLSIVLLYFGPGQTPKTATSQSTASSNSPVVSQGRLERQAIRYYVRLHQPAVRHCYVQELARRRDLRVEVAVDFTVAPNGAVSGCKAGPSAIGQCVAKAICAIRFPAIYDALEDGTTAPSKLTTQVRYRFRFQPPPKKDEPQQVVASRPNDPLERDRAADDADDPQPAPSANPKSPGTTSPPPSLRPNRPGRAVPARTRPGLLRRPATDDPLDGIDSKGDPL